MAQAMELLYHHLQDLEAQQTPSAPLTQHRLNQFFLPKTAKGEVKTEPDGAPVGSTNAPGGGSNGAGLSVGQFG